MGGAPMQMGQVPMGQVPIVEATGVVVVPDAKHSQM
jgi:hypothetical protein